MHGFNALDRVVLNQLLQVDGSKSEVVGIYFSVVVVL